MRRKSPFASFNGIRHYLTRMLKTAFQHELLFTFTVQKGSAGTDVRRVQEWLCLNALRYPNVALATSLDSEFGPATRRAVQNFQALLKTTQTGVVTPELFSQLSAPLATGFQQKPTGVRLFERPLSR